MGCSPWALGAHVFPLANPVEIEATWHYGRNEYRLFFLTEESEESFFDFPDDG